jgi:hypothetical protein
MGLRTAGTAKALLKTLKGVVERTGRGAHHHSAKIFAVATLAGAGL